jgi:hypothetical protein
MTRRQFFDLAEPVLSVAAFALVLMVLVLAGCSTPRQIGRAHV